jgi:hypothetical protein
MLLSIQNQPISTNLYGFKMAVECPFGATYRHEVGRGNADWKSDFESDKWLRYRSLCT